MVGGTRRLHPLVGFGWLVTGVEKWCRGLTLFSKMKPVGGKKQQGVLAWLISVVPPVVLTFFLLDVVKQISVPIWFVMNVVILYLTIGGKSLIEHAENIYTPLKSGDLEQARYAVSMIVSRNTDKMSEKEITSSAIESVLENGNDAVFGPMFWFLILGAPGAVLFRLANTLDAMWGYKHERYLQFGWFTARADDILGWIPARITALAYAFQGNLNTAIECWRSQAKECSSPNGGVVMTTGAGALGVIIGGPTYYHGVLHDKKPMGSGEVADWHTIPFANRFVIRGSFALSYLWLAFVLAGVS